MCRNFLPTWCSREVRADSDSEEDTSAAAKELCKALCAKTKPKQPYLTVTQWIAAYERYALAAVITEQWDMVTAMAS